MTRKLVIYHFPCLDGFSAAWVAKQALEPLDGELVFHEGDYADGPPWDAIDNSDVFILDFSYDSVEEMEEIAERCRTVTLLDHHKTAMEKHGHLPWCTYDMDRSGVGMAWDYFFGKEHYFRPWFIDYVQDRDLWRFELPDSKTVNAYIQLVPKTFEDYTKLSKMRREDALTLGRGAQAYMDSYVEDMQRLVRYVSFAGYDDIPVVNAPFKGISELVGSLAKTAPFAMGYWQRSDGQFQYSLRSIPENGNVDVSEIASRFDIGGGHRHAAGFTTDTLVF